MGVTWTLLTYRCCSTQAQIRCWHFIDHFGTSLVQKIWIKLILRVGILLCIKILVKSSCIWKLIQMFTWLIIRLDHSMNTSVNPHPGPIRFVYFYRCIYLWGPDRLEIPRCPWRFSRALFYPGGEMYLSINFLSLAGGWGPNGTFSRAK